MKKLIVAALASALMTLSSSELNAQEGMPESLGKIDCQECHTCEVPTTRNPCLKQCPTRTMTHITTRHALTEAPDTMLLREIEAEYQPVHFNHKLHADMAEMKDSCSTCHHFSPPGQIPPCGECHQKEVNPKNLSQPGLKGAYHRQCLSCHREWSHDTKCVVCHLPAPGVELTSEAADSTDILGRPHPVITVPAKRVYDTPYKQGPTVTFQHKEHIDLFGFRCVNCHREENCGYCHDLQRPTGPRKTQEEVHAICNDCHAHDQCAKCHDTRERPGFSHNTTGWPLNPYHTSLDCWSCHPTGKRISRLSRMCVNCHAGWNQETFTHAVTGLKLDDVHADLDCTDCHPGRKFESDPVCGDCHDDGRTATTQPPGMRTNR
jgi:hypothetical protein